MQSILWVLISSFWTSNIFLLIVRQASGAQKIYAFNVKLTVYVFARAIYHLPNMQIVLVAGPSKTRDKMKQNVE